MKKLYLKSRTRSNITARNETTIFFLSKCFTFHDRFGNTDHFELAHVSARKVTFYLSRASKLMLVPRKKAHRSFVNASRCLARVKQVREAFATRSDCRYNNSPFLWLWSCYTISYRINWRAHYCGYAPIETHSWSCFLRSLSNDYISKKYYKNLFFVLPYSYSLFFFFSFTPNQYSWNQTRNLTVWNIVHNIVNEARRFICMQQNRETWKTKPQYFFHAIWELPSTNWYDAFCISVLENSVEISWLQVELLTTHGNSLRESPIAGQVTCWANELVFKLTRGVKSVCKNKRSFVIIDLWLLKRGFENRWLD